MPSTNGSRLLFCLLATAACRPAAVDTPSTVHLTDLYRAESVADRVEVAAPPRLEWRFDGEAPAPPPAAFAATRGWQGGPGVGGLAVRDGKLVGRSTGEGAGGDDDEVDLWREIRRPR